MSGFDRILPAVCLSLSLLCLFHTPAHGSRHLGALKVQNTAEAPNSASTEKVLPPWKRVLTGEDSTRVEELEGRITELLCDGDFAEAIPLSEEILETRRRLQGNSHWETVSAEWDLLTLRHATILPPSDHEELAANYAADAVRGSLYVEHRYDEALRLAEWQLEVRRRCLGEEHPDVASLLSGLGELLNVKGEHTRGDSIHLEALRIARKTLGDQHPTVAWSLHNRAALLNGWGKYASAESLYREAVEMNRKLVV